MILRYPWNFDFSLAPGTAGSWEQSLTSKCILNHVAASLLEPVAINANRMLCRYDFLGKDSDRPEQANGTAAPGKSSDERRHRDHKSSRDKDMHRDREGGDDRGHRSSSRDHRSHRSSRHRDERDHRSSRDRERPRDDQRDRHRGDLRGPDSFKRPRVEEPFLPRPPPPRSVLSDLCVQHPKLAEAVLVCLLHSFVSAA